MKKLPPAAMAAAPKAEAPKVDTAKASADLLAAATPEDREAAAKAFSTAVAGTTALAASVATLVAAVGDKSKDKMNARASALTGLRAVLEAAPRAVEPLVAAQLSAVVEAAADKSKPVSVAAVSLAKALAAQLSAHGVMAILPAILAEADGKWQCNLLRVELLSMLAAQFPEQTRAQLVEIIPVLCDLLWDTKPAVKNAAVAAMEAVCGVVNNRDIKGFIPEIVRAFCEPKLVEQAINSLAGVVFVSEIHACDLALIAPLLKRGFDEPATATKRACARITENMAKLVDDPFEVECFMPLLLPALARAKEAVSDPECRDVCDKAHAQLKKTAEQPPKWNRAARADIADLAKPLAEGAAEPVADYIAAVAHSLLTLKNLEAADWEAALAPYVARADAGEAIASLLASCTQFVKVEEAKEEADDAEQLCDCQFSLAYGNKVLLNQTNLKLKRGYRYGLCGQNDSGKTSLMRAIANQQVDGFPPATELRTMFVETDVQGELAEVPVLDFVVNHEGLKEYGITPEMAREKLLSVGFAEDDSTMAPASLTKQVGRLSGGWRMKLALVRAMLMKADILLLDEPTNHLDPGNVKWVIDYLTSLSSVTSIIVSHDIKVLDQVCTHVLQIDQLKLKQYKGNLTYVAQNHVPDLLSYFELKASKFTMRFPTPGMLEGITSKGKHIMKMTNITFTYPGAPKAQLEAVTVRVSLSTRAACIGANGAGKSTMIKLLTGELVPNTGSGEVWKHPNARVAYVAQHAFHHIENHLEKTPNEYIRWRYEHGSDKEGLEKVTAKLSEEEEKSLGLPIPVDLPKEDGTTSVMKLVFDRFTEGRRTANKTKQLEYEVKFKGGITAWVQAEKLIRGCAAFEKLLKRVDDRIAALATQKQRPLTQRFVEAHLNDVGLAPEFATHSRIGALSGGQKVKVVLAAAMWNTPHIVILDEPTNYLDRDSLGAMAEAIHEYDGGVVIISHNAQFVDQVCPEVWHLENHTLNLKGSYDWLESANKEAAKQAMPGDDEYVDGMGNVCKVKAKKKASKKDLKRIKKKVADMRKANPGVEVFTDDELEEEGFEVELA